MVISCAAAPLMALAHKLASEGMRLLNFNVEAQCTPTRSAFMTGRFSIRSGTYEVPIGGVPDGLTTWEIALAQLLSQQGYATGMWGKWHLGSIDTRLPTSRGFDEWYGIPRTYDEAFWPSSNETGSLWPSVAPDRPVGAPQRNGGGPGPDITPVTVRANMRSILVAMMKSCREIVALPQPKQIFG